MNVASPFRALIVDDEPSVRQAVMRALNRSGFTCDAAADGRTAIEMVNQSCFDVVVTDLRMPEANGHKLAADLLEMPTRPAIVVLTGVLEPKLSDDLWARGVDDIQYKPVDFGLLAMKIRRIVDRRRQTTPASLQAAANASAADNSLATKGDTSPNSSESGDSSTSATPEHSKHTRSAESATKQTKSTLTTEDLATVVEKLQRSISVKQQRAAIRCAVLFAGGLLAGWLLSWLGPGAMLWR